MILEFAGRLAIFVGCMLESDCALKWLHWVFVTWTLEDIDAVFLIVGQVNEKFSFSLSAFAVDSK